MVVSAEYRASDPASTTPFHSPVSAQLFLPESWAGDAERRKQAQVPEEIGKPTKPEIALGLLDRARLWGVPIQAVVVDAGYGDNPNFLQGLNERQVPYMCAVQSTFGCRLPDEVQATATQTPVYGGRGQPRKPRPAPLYTVKELIEALPTSAWQTLSWREGTKGMMQVQAVAIRVHWATGSSLHSTSHSRVHTGPEGWLLAHAGFVIEQFRRRCQSRECGLDHYQGRSFDGLHRHLALVMLAYSFLMLYRLTLPLPPGEAFPPLRDTKLAAFRASPGPALVLPGSRPLAAPYPADRVLPSQEKLTK